MKRPSRPERLSETLPGLRRVLIRFAPYLRPYRGLIGGSMAALIAATAMRLLEPWPLKFILDRVIATEGGGGSGIAFIDALDPTTLLALCAGSVVVILGLKAVFQYLSTVGFALVGNRVLTEVRGELFRHLQSLSLSFHTRAKAGDLTMRLIGDVGMLKETAVTAMLPLAANVLILVGMVTVMLILNWQLALIALLPLPLLWFSTVRLGRRIQSVSRKQRQREGDMAATAAETMAGMRVVQSLAIEDRAADIFAGDNARSLKEGVQAKRLAAGLERLVDVLVAAATAIVLWFGALQVLRGQLTPGDLVVFVTYLKNSFRPVREYAKYTGRLAKASAAGERVVQLLDQTPTVQDRSDAATAPPFRGEIAFENVGFHYGDTIPALRDVSVTIPQGQRVAITGPSGSGKSTFASLILRLYDPKTGRVRIDGQDIRDMTLKSLRSQIGLVPQETLMFRASLGDNIALGAGRDVDADEIEAAARLANAHAFISALPEGYETEAAERGATLSAGQRQRIAIARAALRQCPILILDEPTVGLDGANEAEVTEALWRLASDRTSLLITHDLRLAARAERILYIEDGRVAEDGTHAELLAKGGGYAALWASQSGRNEGRRIHVAAG